MQFRLDPTELYTIDSNILATRGEMDIGRYSWKQEVDQWT